MHCEKESQYFGEGDDLDNPMDVHSSRIKKRHDIVRMTGSKDGNDIKLK